jgi:hypothetical protein
MVALLRGHDRAGPKSTGALVGILALPLPPMGRIHAVGKFVVVHQFAYDTVHSTGVYGSSFLVISPNRYTTNGIISLATKVVICTLLLSMILFGHSYRLSGITNI